MPNISDYSVLYQLSSGLRLGDQMDCAKVFRCETCVLCAAPNTTACPVHCARNHGWSPCIPSALCTRRKPLTDTDADS